MAANEFSTSHRVVYYEVDDTGHLTLAMLINLFVLVSEDQNAALALSTEFVQSHGVGWVVTQYHIQVTALPQTGDQVTLKTRATAYNKYFAYREYWLVDAAGNELAYAEGIWVTMSYANRKIAAIPAEIMAPYQTEPVVRLPRLPRPDRVADEVTMAEKPYAVRYFDIDNNGHVNNAHYFDWMLDALPADFLRGHQPTDIRIRYENEVKYGQTVTSAYVQPDESLTSQHLIHSGNVLAANATIKWQKKA
ncbi:acyl-[acyl-carrier-protein] thioesterase [Levilactobacillus cerevisiae]|uniref:acyl-[acyl-carrier-protein] thioesterase n=1 Tax=Levilactobacillus cerevisiae TaxID=1704076 RepID=UPI000F7684E4|nr:acyl-ACP thioesterase domain-containing protein [Levilactobacillus cerevisiae]